MMLPALKALADPSRLRLVAILGHGEFTVQELTAILGMGQSRISRHLKILTDAGILSVKRQGTWSYYRLAEEEDFFTAIRPALESRLPALTEGAPTSRDWRRSGGATPAQPGVLRCSCPAVGYPVPRGAAGGRLPGRTARCGSRLRLLLEVGVGTGALLPELRRKAAEVIGVDHSPAMLEQARARLAAEGSGGIDSASRRDDAPAPCRTGRRRRLYSTWSCIMHAQPADGSGGDVARPRCRRHAGAWPICGATSRNGCGSGWRISGSVSSEEEIVSWLAAAGFAPREFGVVGRHAGAGVALFFSAARKKMNIQSQKGG